MPEQKNNVNKVRNNVVSKQHYSFLHTKQAEVIDPRLLVTHIQFPAPAHRCLQGDRSAFLRSAGYNTAHGGAPSDRLAAAGRKCRWGVLLRAVSKHPAGSSRPALCKCRPAAQIAITYVILPFKISPAGLQCKMHPPFGYSLPKPKGRCECADFQIAGSAPYDSELWVLGQNTMHLYFGLNGAIPYICNRPPPCIHKKRSELLLCGHTFYNELCKCP